MLSCPGCQKSLVRVRSGVGTLWSCAGCGGRGCDVAWLRRQAGEELITHLWSPALEAAGDRERLCPLCGARMLTVPVPADARSVPIDLCKTCKIVWFDREEFETVKAAYAGAAREPQHLLDEKWKWIPAILGFPVERQRAKLMGQPWLTWGVAAVIAAVSLISFSNLPRAINDFGMVPSYFWRYGGLTVITSFLVHGGLLHLAGNLYFLLVFGDNVEDYLGQKLYALLLLMATVGGDGLNVALNPHSAMPTVGASAGISGLVVFYGLQFPRARLTVLLRWLLFYPLKMRARTGLLLWVLWQLFAAWQQLAGFSNISAVSHLGGGAVGLLFWLKWRSA